jgi:hypothetical protein
MKNNSVLSRSNGFGNGLGIINLQNLNLKS